MRKVTEIDSLSKGKNFFFKQEGTSNDVMIIPDMDDETEMAGQSILPINMNERFGEEV